MVQKRLDELLHSNPMMGSGRKMRAQLLILDRSFDMLSPLVHSLTYQAAAYDLLNIPNDVYEYKYQDGAGQSKIKEAVLNEQDNLWVQFRHEHISKVFQGVSANFKSFVASKNQGKSDGTFGTSQVNKKRRREKKRSKEEKSKDEEGEEQDKRRRKLGNYYQFLLLIHFSFLGSLFPSPFSSSSPFFSSSSSSFLFSCAK